MIPQGADRYGRGHNLVDLIPPCSHLFQGFAIFDNQSGVGGERDSYYDAAPSAGTRDSLQERLIQFTRVYK